MDTCTEIGRITRALQRLGVTALLKLPEGELPIAMVLQPVTDRNRSYLETQQTPTGGYRQNYAIGYVAADENGVKVQVDSLLQAGEELWRVRRREHFLFQGQPAYLWTVLTKEENDGPTD